jgi:hypothetical protein
MARPCSICHVSGNAPAGAANPTSVANVTTAVAPFNLNGRPSPMPEPAALNFLAPSLAGRGDQDESDAYDERASRHRDGLLCVAMSAPLPEDRLRAGSVMVNEPFPQSFPASRWRPRAERRPLWRRLGNWPPHEDDCGRAVPDGANEILKTASAPFAVAELDRRLR